MKTKIIPLIVWLLPFLASYTYGQELIKDNDSFFQTVAQRLYAFRTAAPVEKLYVHQDRSRYMAGETVWFKVYRSFSKGIEEGSGVVHVDLTDGFNRPVARTKWKLTDGTADGHSEAKPYGVNGAVAAWAILDAPPADQDALPHTLLATRSPHTIEFKEEARGKTVYLALCWQNGKGQRGPWSDIASGIIP